MRPFSTLALRYPAAVAAVILGLFAVWFALPTILATPVDATGGTGTFDLSDLRPYIVTEATVATALLVLVALCRWGRFTGLRGPVDPKGIRLSLWYLVPGLVIIALVWGGLLTAGTDHALGRQIAMIAVMTLLIGLFEETLFRGVVLNGLRTRMSPGLAILVSGVLFGVFHVVNALVGQDIALTAIQIVSATGLGLFFGAITVQARSVWPAILLHAIWDAFALSMALAFRLSPQAATTTLPQPGYAALIGPALLTLAAWRIHRRWRRRTAQAEERQMSAI